MQTLYEQEPTRTVVQTVQETPLSEETVASEQTTLPKTGKRIVSKREYVLRKAKRTGILTTGTSLLAISGISVVSGMMFLTWLVLVLWHGHYFLPVFTASGLLLGSVVVAYGAFRGGLASLKHAAQIDTGVPLTRANTADLPAPDSLVRASSEPLQAQEAVLLRAVAQGQETPPEQLVRASVGQE